MILLDGKKNKKRKKEKKNKRRSDQNRDLKSFTCKSVLQSLLKWIFLMGICCNGN